MKQLFKVTVIISIICFANSVSYGDYYWVKTYFLSSSDRLEAVHQTSDDGYVVAGYTDAFSSTSRREIWILRRLILVEM